MGTVRLIMHPVFKLSLCVKIIIMNRIFTFTVNLHYLLLNFHGLVTINFTTASEIEKEINTVASSL